MDALALFPEHAQEFYWSPTRGPEPVRIPGVKFRGLTSSHDVMLSQDQPNLTRHDEYPLVADVGSWFGFAIRGSDRDLERLRLARMLRQRGEGSTIGPCRSTKNARVFDLRRRHNLLERHSSSLFQQIHSQSHRQAWHSLFRR